MSLLNAAAKEIMETYKLRSFFKFDKDTPFIHDKLYQILSTMPMHDGVNLTCQRVEDTSTVVNSLKLVDEEWLRNAEGEHSDVPDSRFMSDGFPDNVVHLDSELSVWPKIDAERQQHLSPFDCSTKEMFTFKIQNDKIKPYYHNLLMTYYGLYMVYDSERKCYIMYVE